MAASKTARAAPARAGSDPQKFEQLGGRLDFENSFASAPPQAQKIGATFSTIDPAHVATLGAFAIWRASE